MTLYQLNKYKEFYLKEKQNYLFSIKKNILGGTNSNDKFYLEKINNIELVTSSSVIKNSSNDVIEITSFECFEEDNDSYCYGTYDIDSTIYTIIINNNWKDYKDLLNELISENSKNPENPKNPEKQNKQRKSSRQRKASIKIQDQIPKIQDQKPKQKPKQKHTIFFKKLKNQEQESKDINTNIYIKIYIFDGTMFIDDYYYKLQKPFITSPPTLKTNLIDNLNFLKMDENEERQINEFIVIDNSHSLISPIRSNFFTSYLCFRDLNKQFYHKRLKIIPNFGYYMSFDDENKKIFKNKLNTLTSKIIDDHTSTKNLEHDFFVKIYKEYYNKILFHKFKKYFTSDDDKKTSDGQIYNDILTKFKKNAECVNLLQQKNENEQYLLQHIQKSNEFNDFINKVYSKTKDQEELPLDIILYFKKIIIKFINLLLSDNTEIEPEIDNDIKRTKIENTEYKELSKINTLNELTDYCLHNKDLLSIELNDIDDLKRLFFMTLYKYQPYSEISFFKEDSDFYKDELYDHLNYLFLKQKDNKKNLEDLNFKIPIDDSFLTNVQFQISFDENSNKCIELINVYDGPLNLLTFTMENGTIYYSDYINDEKKEYKQFDGIVVEDKNNNLKFELVGNKYIITTYNYQYYINIEDINVNNITNV